MNYGVRKNIIIREEKGGERVELERERERGVGYKQLPKSVNTIRKDYFLLFFMLPRVLGKNTNTPLLC